MKKEIHLICNAHIDPIWQWDWPEGVSAVLSTFNSAVRLAQEYDYVFCHNEVTVYKYVEEYAPELFEEIKELVRQGRWHIMGGWYLQPDCNMPSGESFVRQIREGQRYFAEKFGIVPTTAINFDPFGHTVGLVQIIKKCGQDSYIFMRPYANELELPSNRFVWKGLDGSEIKAWRSGAYNTPLGKGARAIRHSADNQNFEVGAVLWGVGNHGGGPSRKDLEDIKRDLLSDPDTLYIHSTPEVFFKKVNPTDTVNSSLRTSMPGCYTTMSRVKKHHALLEKELYLAEKMATVACAQGLLEKYPEEELRGATEDLLNAEFHDVLPGTSVQCGEDAGLRFLNHGLLQAERVKVRAYFALSRTEEPAREGEYPIVVFNPHPYGLTENVECEFMLADQNWDSGTVAKIRVLDGEGNELPHQLVKEESNINLDWRKRVVFEARLKPLALARFSVYVETVPNTKKELPDCFIFDNGRKHVEIDRNTGLLSSYRIDGVEYLSEGAGLFSFDDNADPWAMAAHQQKRLGTNGQPFALSQKPEGVFEGMKSVQVIEDGKIYLGIEAFFESGHSRARIGYKIYKNNDAVDIDITVFFGDIDRMIKYRLPVAFKGRLIGQTAFGTEELFEDARENVAQRFVAIRNNQKALALFNRDVYGNHFEDGALYMSLLRGATYCAHPIEGRELIPSDRFTKKIDQGENRFSFRLLLTDLDKLERDSREFTEQPFAQNIFPLECKAKAEGGIGLELGDKTVSLVAMKKASGRDAVIFRLLNNTENAVDTHITAFGRRLPLSFGKYEVKTVVFEDERLFESSELLI